MNLTANKRIGDLYYQNFIKFVEYKRTQNKKITFPKLSKYLTNNIKQSLNILYALYNTTDTKNIRVDSIEVCQLKDDEYFIKTELKENNNDLQLIHHIIMNSPIPYFTRLYYFTHIDMINTFIDIMRLNQFSTEQYYSEEKIKKKYLTEYKKFIYNIVDADSRSVARKIAPYINYLENSEHYKVSIDSLVRGLDFKYLPDYLRETYKIKDFTFPSHVIDYKKFDKKLKTLYIGRNPIKNWFQDITNINTIQYFENIGIVDDNTQTNTLEEFIVKKSLRGKEQYDLIILDHVVEHINYDDQYDYILFAYVKRLRERGKIVIYTFDTNYATESYDVQMDIIQQIYDLKYELPEISLLSKQIFDYGMSIMKPKKYDYKVLIPYTKTFESLAEITITK